MDEESLDIQRKAIESLIRDAASWKKKRDRAIRATRLTQFSLNKGFLKNLLTRNEKYNDRLKTHSKAQENVNQDQPSTSKDGTPKTDYEKSIRLRSNKKKTRSRSSSSETDSSSSDDDSTSSSSDSSIEVIIKKKRKRKKYRKSKRARKSISPSSSPTYEDLKKCINKSFYSKYFKIPKESTSKGNKKQLKPSVRKLSDKNNLEGCTQENNSNENKTFDQLSSKDPIEIIAEENERAGQLKESSNELPLKKGSTKSPNIRDKSLLKTCDKNENNENYLESKHDLKHSGENKITKSSHNNSSTNDDKKLKNTPQKANSLYSSDEEDIFLKIVPLPEKPKKGHDDSQNLSNKSKTEEIRVKSSENNEVKDLKNNHQSTEKIVNAIYEKEEKLNKNDSNAFVKSVPVDKVDESMETGQSKISFSLSTKVNKTVDKPTEFQQQELDNSDQSETKKSSSRLKKRLKKSKKKSKKIKRKGRSSERRKDMPKNEAKGRSRSRDKSTYSHRRHRSSSYDDTPKSTSRRRSYSKSPSRYSKGSYSSSSSKSRYRSYSRGRSISDRSYRSYSRSSHRTRSRSRRKYSSSRYSYSSVDRRSSSYRDSRSISRHRSRSRSTTKSRSRRRSISFSYVYTNPEKARKYYKRSISSSSTDSDRSRRKYKDK